AVAGVPLHTLTAGGPTRWVHVRTVSKFLGTDLRWAAAACDATTLARHDGTRALAARAQETYALRRGSLLGELADRGIGARGASGMNLWVPVRDESAVVNGLRSYGWWVAAGARFRLSSAPGVRISVAELEPADAARLASDFAAVLGESEATYG